MGFNIFKKFKRDDKRVNDGAPMTVGYTDSGDPVHIFVSRMHQSNQAFKTFVENAKRMVQTTLDRADGETREKMLEKIAHDAVESVLIKGWSSNMIDVTGALLHFSPEAVARIRAELPELFDEIVQFASDAANFVGEFKEDETLKN